MGRLLDIAEKSLDVSFVSLAVNLAAQALCFHGGPMRLTFMELPDCSLPRKIFHAIPLHR
jgi:hypothetical protein